MSTVPIDNNKEGSFEDMIRRAENEPQKPQWQRRKGVMKRKWVAKHNLLLQWCSISGTSWFQFQFRCQEKSKVWFRFRFQFQQEIQHDDIRDTIIILVLFCTPDLKLNLAAKKDRDVPGLVHNNKLYPDYPGFYPSYQVVSYSASVTKQLSSTGLLWKWGCPLQKRLMLITRCCYGRLLLSFIGEPSLLARINIF